MKLPVLFAVFAFCLCSCLKSNDYKPCTPVKPEAESMQLADFCDSHDINYTKDTNGIYYQIIYQGSGETPTLDSKISVIYTSTFLNDSLLEDHSSTPVTDLLQNFIEGWRLAIPYIQKGGHMKMVVPSALCYGCSGNPGYVPSNAPLYFDLVLVSVE